MESLGHSRDFLAGGGEMGALIREYDWASTPLGPPEDWSQGLKTAVRLLLSTGHPMFIWWGPDLIQFYNDAYRRSIGPERHPSAIGQPGRECWAEIWDIIGPQIEQVMAGRGHTWNENHLVPITRHGRREDVYWTYSYGPIDDPSSPNGVGGVLVVCTETTEQVLAEQRMKAAEARWRALFDQSPGIMCILQGPHHVFEFANPRYVELVGGREILGKRLLEALPEVRDQGFVERLDEVYRTGNAHLGLGVPVSLSSPSGTGENRRYLDFVYQPIRAASGEVTGILVSGSDVTDRVAAHDKLREEDRRKDEFLAMLAHELRNPLAPISYASELLTRMAGADPKVRSIGELLGRQVAQLTRLVDDLLDVSRISQGRIELQRKPVELRSAVRLAVDSLQWLLRERKHELVSITGAEPLYVQGDEARLVQCVVNLLHNAAKYTPSGGRIEVSLRAANGRVVIQVTDTGVGISSDLLPRVFDLFVQADRTLDRAQGGLGIGLSVVRRLVEMHGGEVSARSEGLGRGTTFQIELPQIEPPDTAVAPEEALEGTPQRVLVVDDNFDAADALAQYLTLSGHQVEAVHTARDALERAAMFAPSVVLLDIGLPEMDGYEVAQRLRATHPSAVLVAVTGYGRPEDVQRSKEAGFAAHMTKPAALSELKRIFKELERGGGSENGART
jgi:signal transduction histidine kinase/CheY-like chemotaxis protein